MSGVIAGILRDAGERSVPVPAAAILELTRKCNLSCRHCYAPADGGRRELTRAELVRVLDELRGIGTLFLTFLGGDPTVSRDFLPLLRHASENRFALQFYSNGLLIDERTADELARLNVLHAGISLYGAKAETHDDVTRRRGSHAKTLRAARLLRERGLHVVFKFVAMNRNAHEAFDAVAMADSMGIPIRVNTTITARDNLARDTFALRLAEDPLKRLMRAFHWKDWAPHEVDRSGHEDLRCGMGRTLLSINAYGDVYPCVTLPLAAGNVREAPLERIWRESPLLRELRAYPRPGQLRACEGCRLRSHCDRCPGQTYTETGDLYGPCPSACREAVLHKGLENEARGIEEAVPLPPGLDESHLPGWTASEVAEGAGCMTVAERRGIVEDPR